MISVLHCAILNTSMKCLWVAMLHRIKGWIYFRRNRQDFCAQLLFYCKQIQFVFVSNKIDRKSQMSVSSRSPDTMQVGFSVVREIKVDDNIHGLNIDATRAQIRRYKASTISIAESVEHFVPIFLQHFGVDVVTRESKL